MSRIQLLDATLRDGGQGLSFLHDEGFFDRPFTEEVKHRMVTFLDRSGIEHIELGAIGPSPNDRSAFAIYQDVEQLSRYLPKERDDGKMFVGLYIGPDTDIDAIPQWNPSLVKGVRVILRYSELRKSLDYCAALAKKGYCVFVQPMLTMRYTDQELDLVLSMANDMGAYACYFVDSYGYMMPDDVRRLFSLFDRQLEANIKIGFHTHNNMSTAFSNILCFLDLETEREKLIDACATGIGQGAGNLPTELIVPYLNEHYGTHYDYGYILDACELLEMEIALPSLWGYSVTRLLPALYKTAYKFALVMRSKYGLSLRQINEVLSDMPADMRYRYTKDDLEQSLANHHLL